MKENMNPTRRTFIKSSSLGLLGGSAVALSELEGCSTSQVLATILADLPVAVQIATSIATIVAAAQGGVVTASLQMTIQNWSSQAKTDLTTLQTLVTTWNNDNKDTTTLGKIDNLINSIIANLTNVLDAFHVADPTLQSTVAASLGAFSLVIVGIQALLPPPPAAPTARLSLAKKSAPESSANAIKEAFNLIVGKHYPTAVIPVS